jgi:hypothetical protein
MKFDAGPGEDGRTNIERGSLGDLDSRIEQILDCRKRVHAMAQPLGDISIELEEGIQGELIQIVIELAA